MQISFNEPNGDTPTNDSGDAATMRPVAAQHSERPAKRAPVSKTNSQAATDGRNETDNHTFGSPRFAELARAVVDAEMRGDLDTALATRTELWATVFGLPGWLLIATELEGQARPHVRQDGSHGSVLAFTDECAALRYQADRGLTFRAGYATLQVGVDAALDMLEEMARQTPVDGPGGAGPAGAGPGGAGPGGMGMQIRFNDAAESFSAPIAMLRRLRQHVEQGNDLEAIESTVVDVSAAPPEIGPILAAAGADPATEPQAMTALFGLPDWWFVCNPRQPDAFHVRRFSFRKDGQMVKRQTVVAFSSHRLALEATDRYGVADEDGSIVLMQMPVNDAVQWLQSFREHEVETVMFDPLTTPLPLSIEDLPAAWQRHRDDAVLSPDSPDG